MSVFLVTLLTCSQLSAVLNKVRNNVFLTTQQKQEIVLELKKVVPTCPLIITK